MRKIFCFGNEFFEGDEIAIEIAKQIKKTKNFEFITCISPNEILNAKEELIILDVVKGLKYVKIISNIDDLVLSNSVTCHDLDLGFYLKLMKESGKIDSVKIIGLPFGEKNYNKLKTEILKKLEELDSL